MAPLFILFFIHPLTLTLLFYHITKSIGIEKFYCFGVRKALKTPSGSSVVQTWRHTFASHLMMKPGNIRAIQKLLGHKSMKTTEIYAHLSDKHLHHVVSLLPSPNLGIVLGISAVLPGKGITQVVDNKMVGDTGFEPVTSTVCRRPQSKRKRRK
jgi:hypothetical protein